MMKSITENSNGSINNNWLGFSVSSSSPSVAVQVSDSMFLSPLHHLNSSSAQCFSQVAASSPKLENFLGSTHERETMALSLDIFQHQTSYYGVGDFFQPQISDCNAQISEMANWVDNGGSLASMAYADLQSLTLSMSPGSQSSCVNNPTAQISSSISDCLPLESKKRGFGKVGQKKPVHRKSIDTFGQRTSQYRGVTKHRWTGRYEAHLWDNSCKKEGQSRKGRQVYLGGYDMEEKAARAYDLAALKYWGPSTHTNFLLENYKDELEEMKNMNRQEYVAHLRRKSSGFSRGASMYRGVTRHHQHGRWQARIGRVAGNKDLYLGTFSTQEEAAEAYDIAAIKFRGVCAVTNFDITRYDVEKILSSNNLLGGEQAKKIKALDHQINNPIDHQMMNTNANTNTALDLIGDESNKVASVQISNASSIVTSLNSSSREGSPDKSGSPSNNILMVQKPPNIAWITPAQMRPANGVINMTQLPVFAAWNDA